MDKPSAGLRLQDRLCARAHSAHQGRRARPHQGEGGRAGKGPARRLSGLLQEDRLDQDRVALPLMRQPGHEVPLVPQEVQRHGRHLQRAPQEGPPVGGVPLPGVPV